MTAKFALDSNVENLAITHFGGALISHKELMRDAVAKIESIYGRRPIIARDFLSMVILRDQIVSRYSKGAKMEDLYSWEQDDIAFEEDFDLD